jgi:hypothetical protein
MDMYLRGYTIMGFNKSKIEREIRIKEIKNKLKEFEEDNFYMIEEFFKLAVEGGLFLDDKTGKPSSPNDDLKWRKRKGNYIYLLARIPRVKQQPKLTPEQLQLLAMNRLPGAAEYLTKKPQLQPNLNNPYQQHLFAEKLRLQRHQPRPERGKVGGKSKYLPKTLKPATKEKEEKMLEMCRKKFEDRPIEKELADEECK